MDILLALLILLTPLVVLLIVYITKTNSLSRKVEDLEREIHRLKSAVGPPKPATESPSASVIPSQKTKIEPTQVSPTQPATKVTPPDPRAAIVHPIPSTPTFQQPSRLVQAPQPSRTKAEWETLIGGKVLNRIGAIALIIGVGFFLKYAFDNNWITETMRVLIGIVVGMALLLGGARSHERGFHIFAQGLIGAGISILYLSVYASFNFYHLISQTIAFVLMSAVTTLAFLQAFKYDSLAVSLLGWVGGFLTPFLLSTGRPNEVGLFTYIAFLDAGLLAVLVKKDSWVVLEPLTLAATYLTYGLWYQQYYTPENLFPTVFFISIFWGLFYALHVYHAIRSTSTFPEIRQGVSALNAFLYYVAMYAIINPQHHDWMSSITLVIGIVYFLTVLAIKRWRPIAEIVFAQYTLTAIILLVLATAIQFSGFTTVVYWSLEALILVWCGVHWKLRYVWRAALGLFGLAAFKLLFTEGALSYSPIDSFTLILNQRALAFSVVAAMLGASTLFFKRLDGESGVLIRSWLRYSWCITIFALCTIETIDYFGRLLLNTKEELADSLVFMRFLTLAMVWIVYSLTLVWYGLRKEVSPILYCGLGALALAITMAAIRGIAFDPIQKFTVVLNFRAAALILVIVGSFVHERWLRKSGQAHDWIPDLLSSLQVAIVLLILSLVTGETRDFFERAIYLLKQHASSSDISSELNNLTNLQQLSLSGVWLLYSMLLMITGIWRRLQGLRIISIVLFGITILKIFSYDLSFLQTLYRIFSFIGLGLILLAVSYLYQRYKAVVFDSASKNG